jgi:hypothetical protein
VLLAIGCDVASSNLRAVYELRAVDGQLHVGASFTEDDRKRPLADDRVVVTFRGRDFVLESFAWWHRGQIDLETPFTADELISVTLQRDGEPDAVSTITVPPLPDVRPLPLFIPRSAPLTLSWSTITDDTMNWRAEASCIGYSGGEIPPGTDTITIKPEDWRSSSSEYVQTCTTRLTVTRYRMAPVDPAFAEGTMHFFHDYVAEFASTP